MGKDSIPQLFKWYAQDIYMYISVLSNCPHVCMCSIHKYLCMDIYNMYVFYWNRKCCNKPTRLAVLNYTSCIYIYLFTCMCVCKCACMYKCHYHLAIEIHSPAVNKARCTELHVEPISGGHGRFMFINSNGSRMRR